MKICLLCEGVTATELTTCSSCASPLVPTDEVHFPLRRGEEDAAHPLIGTRIDGKYRLTSVLGKGGMGTVFRAVHEVSLAPVALKILHPRLAQRVDHRAWFLAEARKAGRVIHENTARVQDVGEAEDGTIYIAMELVQGVTLHEWMRSERPAADVVVELLHQLCSALAAAHEVGLVHRDLTPRNVMVTARDGRITTKILDFGISKAPPQRTDTSDTATGNPTGFANPPYSAPEHLLGQEVDPRADLYSLGVIAYELLSGKSPVEGKGQMALASATIAGRVQPLVPRVKTPNALVRIVTALLARDPRQRPSSASEVRRGLERLRDPGRTWLPPLALLTFLAAVIFLAVAYSKSAVPFLRSAAGSALVFASDPLPAHEPPRWCRSALLRDLRFDFGGFPASELRLEVFQRGNLARVHSLHPVVEPEGGRLTLSAAAEPSFASLLPELLVLSKDVPLDLVLVVPGQAPLGYARVRLDDAAPVCELALAGSPARGGAVLAGSVEVRSLATDDLGLARLQLLATGPALGSEGRREFPLEPGMPEQSVLARDLLGNVLAGVRPSGALTLVLEAIDRAGNTTRSLPLEWQSVDLHVARIRSATSPEGGRALTHGPRGARLRLQTSGREDSVTVLVEAPDASTRSYERPESVNEDGLEILLQPAREGSAFLDGSYVLRLCDAAGNRGEPFRETFTFRTEDTRPALRVPESGAARHALIRGERLIVDGNPEVVEFSCNRLYRPARATLRPARPPGAVALDPGPRLETRNDGFAAIQLPALPYGEFVLELELQDVRGEAPRKVEYPVSSLPSPPVLKLPDAAKARFLREVQESGLLRADGQRLLQGDAWRLVPPDARFVRARLFHGQPQLAQIGTSSPEAAEAPLADGIPLVDGENTFALALVDLFDRKVEVQIGDAPAQRVRVGDEEIALVARFWHRSTPPAARTLLVEYGKPARLEIRVELPLRDELDRARSELTIEGVPLAATRIVAQADAATLEFVVPFERAAAAARLLERSAAEFAQARSFRFPARLQTPAGSWPLELEGRTIRSVLQTVTLGQVAATPGALPEVLAQVRMIPVPRPLPGAAWKDPVPATVPGRAALRPEPEHDVRNLSDVFLARGELTRAEYAAAIGWLLALPAGQRPRSEVLVHAADPLKGDRLTLLGMTPHLGAERGSEFTRWVALAPARPVTGLNWFQAHTLARIVGAQLGDPNLLRLPLGVELERAALAARVAGGQSALNGVADATGSLAAAHETARGRLLDAGRWPPLESESEGFGDHATTELGERVVALDFGVREWTADLPYVQDVASSALVLEWLGDAERHLEHATLFAEGVLTQSEIVPLLAVHGVVRGAATGEVRELVDVLGGRSQPPNARMPALGNGVPGVVRTTYLRRDGQGLLPAERDARLLLVGMRLCGGEAFVHKARQR